METWDAWKEAARRAGVSEELAALGREVLRDYVQHGLDAADPQRQQLGAKADYMLDLARHAPAQAFLDFNASLIWGGASGQDGDVVAFSLLIEKLGSRDAADQALRADEKTVAALKLRHNHA